MAKKSSSLLDSIRLEFDVILSVQLLGINCNCNSHANDDVVV